VKMEEEKVRNGRPTGNSGRSNGVGLERTTARGRGPKKPESRVGQKQKEWGVADPGRNGQPKERGKPSGEKRKKALGGVARRSHYRPWLQGKRGTAN